jgi:DNA-binding IclR family transcriptional regulator
MEDHLRELDNVAPTPTNGHQSAGSARRVLDILVCFTRSQPTHSSRDLSVMTGIALPSVYRYVALLREVGLLVSDERGSHRLSVRVLALAEAAEAGDELIGVADPVMRNLAAATGETVLLVRLVGESAVCVHRIESSHRLRLAYEPGQPVSLERGASARLLLSSLPDKVRTSLLDRVRSRDASAGARLEREVRLAQHRGWATSTEEIDPGIWAASAAVRDTTGRVAAVLTVLWPLVRAPADERARLLEHVRTAAGQVADHLRAAVR